MQKTIRNLYIIFVIIFYIMHPKYNKLSSYQYERRKKMKELIFRSQNGDKEAYTELIKLIQNDLYRIARSKLTDLDDINDAIQETIIKSYKKLNKLQNIDTFKSWIIKILINECNQIYRKKSKKNSQ